MRENIAQADLEGVVSEEVEEEVRQAAEISMGTEVGGDTVRAHQMTHLPLFQISEQDIANITHLCDQVGLAVRLIFGG